MKLYIVALEKFVNRVNQTGGYVHLIAALNKRFPGSFEFIEVEGKDYGNVMWNIEGKALIEQFETVIEFFVDGYMAAHRDI